MAWPLARAQRTREEQAILDFIAKEKGELTEAEIRRSLAQARQVGCLPYDPADGCGYRVD